MVSSGDTLALRNNKEDEVTANLTLGIHLTLTGMPEDCHFMQNIQVSQDASLADLKD
jgi:hypothetical protein